MLHSKDTNRISEIKTQFDSKENITSRFLNWLSFFEFKSVYKSLDPLKKKGFKVSDLLGMLLIVPFTGKTNMYSLLQSSSAPGRARKDSFYRMKKMHAINWEKLLFAFAGRFVKICLAKGTGTVPGHRMLIIDDSLLPKSGTIMENISRLWDHVSMRYVLGYRMLVLGYFDGKSFLPVSFSLHREKGKREASPYGLKRMEYQGQYHKERNAESPAGKRTAEMDKDKITTAIRMIKQACGSLEVDYLLMDSWFTCEKMLACAHSVKVKLIGMMKMGNARYLFRGKEYTARELIVLLKKSRQGAGS